MPQRGLRARSWSWVALPFLLLGCDGGDPTGSGSLSVQEAEALFQEVADDGTVRLPSAHILFHQVREALHAGAGLDAEIRALIEQHEALLRGARQSREEGDLDTARLLAEEARHLQFEIVVAVLGDDIAESTVGSVENALARFRARIEGRWIPRLLMSRLEAASNILKEAREALDSGDPAAALALALRAAEGLRSLSPEAFSVRAEAAIERADAALEGALLLIGDGTDPRAVEAAERAALLLDRARRSFENGAFAAALELSLTSSQHSARAVQLIRRGVDSLS